MGNDLFIGGVRFTPDFDNMGTPQEQWYELSGGGKVLIAIAYQPSSVRPVLSTQSSKLIIFIQGQSLTVEDFELTTVIGKGSFGKVSYRITPTLTNLLIRSKVLQVRKRDTGRIYALKTLRKQHIVERGEITHTLAERMVLARVNNPFIVPLKFSFQSEQKLYLVLA